MTSVIYVTNQGATATQIVQAGQGAIFCQNGDSTNTVYIGDTNAITPGDLSQSIPLGPGGTITFDGSTDKYAITKPGIVVGLAAISGATSYFQPATLNGLGGIKAFVQNTVPSGSIPVNSIWFEPGAGALFTWNGSVWVQQEFDATQVITAGTIVASLVAAGTVIAGIVDGTSIESAQYFSYVGGGSPSPDNLQYSFSFGGGTDIAGNDYLAGVVVYQNFGGSFLACQVSSSGGGSSITFYESPTMVGATWAIVGSIFCNLGSGLSFSATGGIFTEGMTVQSSPLNITSPWTVPTAGVSIGVAPSGSSSIVQYSNSDGTVLGVGKALSNATGQTINNTAFNPITGLDVFLGVGAWKFEIRLQMLANFAAGQWETELLFSGTATCNFGFKWESAGNLTALNANRTAFGGALNGPSPSANQIYWVTYTGEVNVTVPGHLSLYGATSIAADTWTVYSGSWIEASPIV